MLGSDWPVSLRAGRLEATTASLREKLTGLSPAERESLEQTTAQAVYGVTSATRRAHRTSS